MNIAVLIMECELCDVYLSTVSIAADSGIILNKLKKHKFPEHKWMDLAFGLMLADRVPGIESENRSDLSRLIALVNHWTANVDESGRWETLVDAVNMCEEYIVAKNLAKDVCVPCPPTPESCELDSRHILWLGMCLALTIILL